MSYCSRKSTGVIKNILTKALHVYEQVPGSSIMHDRSLDWLGHEMERSPN